MTFGSLFTGIGGIDLGLERAGMECRWQVENNEFCRAVLNKHWPNVTLYENANVRRQYETVDLICAGWPCQPYSSASRGRKTSRDLWPAVRHTLKTTRPAWFLGENVPRIEGTPLNRVVSDLGEIGYKLAVFQVPACAFGYDHRRDRLWIVGYANRHREPGEPGHAEAPRVSYSIRRPKGLGTKDGFSRRMDRLKALGNAAVPDIAEWFGKNILEVSAS